MVNKLIIPTPHNFSLTKKMLIRFYNHPQYDDKIWLDHEDCASSNYWLFESHGGPNHGFFRYRGEKRWES